MKPKILADEIRSFNFNFTGGKPIPHTVRVRVVDLDDRTVAIVFSQNRIPEIEPGREVINPGKRLEDCVNYAAYLAAHEWGLVPPGKNPRWFIHYDGYKTDSPKIYFASSFDEVRFTTPIDEGVPVGQNWIQIGIDVGKELTGLEL